VNESNCFFIFDFIIITLHQPDLLKTMKKLKSTFTLAFAILFIFRHLALPHAVEKKKQNNEEGRKQKKLQRRSMQQLNAPRNNPARSASTRASRLIKK